MDSYQHGGAVIRVRHTTGHLAEDGSRRRMLSPKRLVWIVDRGGSGPGSDGASVAESAAAACREAASGTRLRYPPPVPATPTPEKAPKVETPKVEAPPAIDETQGTYDWQKCQASHDPDCWKREGKRVDSYWTGFGKAMHDYWKGFGQGVAHYWSKLRGGS